MTAAPGNDNGPQPRRTIPPFTEEHEDLRESIRSFIEREVRPHTPDWERAREFPRELFARMGELGFLGIARIHPAHLEYGIGHLGGEAASLPGAGQPRRGASATMAREEIAMTDRVVLSLADGIADVRLARPEKLNALDPAMFEALLETGRRLGEDRRVRAVVLSGEGRAFCAGLDTATCAAMAGGPASDVIVGPASRAPESVPIIVPASVPPPPSVPIGVEPSQAVSIRVASASAAARFIDCMGFPLVEIRRTLTRIGPRATRWAAPKRRGERAGERRRAHHRRDAVDEERRGGSGPRAPSSRDRWGHGERPPSRLRRAT